MSDLKTRIDTVAQKIQVVRSNLAEFRNSASALVDSISALHIGNTPGVHEVVREHSVGQPIYNALSTLSNTLDAAHELVCDLRRLRYRDVRPAAFVNV